MSTKEFIRLASSEVLGTPLPLGIDVVFVDEKRFARTDGKRVWLSSPDKEDAYVAIHMFNHEILHLLLEHVERGRKIVLQDRFHWWLWNLAVDHVVNSLLSSIYPRVEGKIGERLSRIAPLDGEVLFPARSGVPADAPAEAIYRWLLKQKVTFKSTELPFGRLVEAVVDACGKKKFRFFFVELFRDGTSVDSSGFYRSEFKRKVLTAGSLSWELEREWELASKGGVNLEKELEAYLTTFASSRGETLTFLKPNKRVQALGYPLLVPSRTGRKVRALVAIDTSGSITFEELSAFLSVLYRVSHLLDMEVLFCDAEISEAVDLKGLSPDAVRERIKRLKPRGGGGTSYEPVFSYYFDRASRYQLLIYFTDLVCKFPKKHPPKILWVVQLNEATYKVEVPYGKIIWA